jgi:hypothetical protein
MPQAFVISENIEFSGDGLQEGQVEDCDRDIPNLNVAEHSNFWGNLPLMAKHFSSKLSLRTITRVLKVRRRSSLGRRTDL